MTKNKLGIAIATAMVLLVGLLLLYERREEIDLTSGRIREQQILGGAVVSDSIKETDFSRILALPTDPQKAVWKTTYSRGLYETGSDHYRYQATPNDLRQFALLCEMSKMPPADRSRNAEHILTLLKDGDADDVSRFVEALASSQVRGEFSGR